MSKKSVLEPPDEKPEDKPKGSYGIEIPFGTVSITISGDSLLLDVIQSPTTPKKKDG